MINFCSSLKNITFMILVFGSTNKVDCQPPLASNVQMGFYDFVANMHSPSPSMLIATKHPTYDVPECYATILERFRCHLTEDQGLVWSGLAAKSPIQWEPSTTVVKVNSYILVPQSYCKHFQLYIHLFYCWIESGIVTSS